MRILIVGAGAIGGYFGGRMLQAGRDITFLVRPRRAAELAAAGLVIKSPNGDVTLKDPPVVQADTIKDKFDVVLLSCKAYDLDDAIKSLAPAVGENTSIIPLLNGMRHLDVLDKQFGASHVLGGLCLTAVTLNDKREVVQLGPIQSLGFGERDGKMSHRVRAIADLVGNCNFDGAASETVLQDMWEKWVFLASNAASTSLMRAPIGMILAAPGGRDFLLGILDESRVVATAEGSSLTASMFRDIKAGQPIEADHVIGDLIARADAARIPVPRLRTAYTHLKAYEQTRR
ncbi:hypothetical protein S58_64240 [Bradyrhizobium oligotrophicum S58]|uniref:2-dehydropantoate 2-reductase n=1 Tax=Bradyrhizobium oligotrophicum S58 TaxID=1245469 RepID=M4ZEX2_9BRAD|nr:2-dehydropantoate 2-reductase [Bradyrhizobium oligotrophicum]BAM92397.1 hypothetical protein S58_64240 [Bradyrhizobium oligotrophicum S58]